MTCKTVLKLHWNVIDVQINKWNCSVNIAHVFMMMLAGAVPSQIVILRQVINLSFFLDNCNAVDHLHSFI